jgi:hypothetical protein
MITSQPANDLTSQRPNLMVEDDRTGLSVLLWCGARKGGF